MKKFSYKGVIPASKSLMNRALICGRYKVGMEVLGHSNCDDVAKMRLGLAGLSAGQPMDCGSAGTTLRFLALAASRVPGTHRLTGSDRLFSRPQRQLMDVIQLLGVKSYLDGDTTLVIESSGWINPQKPIHVDRSVSSQFASGLLINAWNLPFELKIEWGPNLVSDGYWKMTVEMVRQLGMTLTDYPQGLVVGKNQSISEDAIKYVVESDFSSAFAVAALAVVGGEAQLAQFPNPSLQPDKEFIAILKSMNVPMSEQGATFTVGKQTHLKPVRWDLVNCPDLFPVLSVLCALADGTSELYGAPHLVHKESNRLRKSADLVEAMGRTVEVKSDGMLIHGRTERDFTLKPMLKFDTDEDHRLAFAAAVAQLAGLPVEILKPDVVNKSFPEFWDIYHSGQDPGGN
ncbi:MAG: 3-phosphoshikimate 1-carboxyvinyltransferase [Pseudobdellovibrionaceae bacterium]|nr:MAG: 3-phosphoshikimate 1-carboxyvinyltransferase [Pseudobdellovibrionaceae bacterium]